MCRCAEAVWQDGPPAPVAPLIFKIGLFDGEVKVIMNIKIDINDKEVRQRLAQLAAGCANLKPLMSNIGEEIRRLIEKNFAVGGRPDAWKPSARSRREGGMPLSGGASWVCWLIRLRGN